MELRSCALALACLCACGDSAEGAALGDAATQTDGRVPDASASSDASASDASAPVDAARADGGGAPAREVRLPPVNGGLDYQLGQPYAPPSGVGIVSRDRTATPAEGLYNICYVNGFQAQQAEEDFWLNEQPDLVLRDDAGAPVIDRDWDEMLLDVGSTEKRTRLAAIVGDWIAGCARAGFDAVEIDNLDTFSRSAGRLTEDDAVAFIALLADVAHEHGLAIAQKNSSELVARRGELKTDFVVAEECNRYDECDVYMRAYGEHVLMVEYRRGDFDRGCSAYADYPLVLRDLALSAPGSGSYVFEGC